MDKEINYYGIDRELKTVDYGPVSMEQALKAAEERSANLKPGYATGEEALAETMFGFSRSRGTFIEICIQGRLEIDLKLEMPEPKKFLFLGGTYHKEVKLGSAGELAEHIKAFFTMEAEAYRQYLDTCKPGK